MTGSATLNDWQHGVSDIDLVLIISRPADPDDLAAIAELHAASKQGTPIDGIYLTESELAAGPDELEAVPQVVSGELVASESGGELSWVTWLEIENGVELTFPDAGAPRWKPSHRRFPHAREGAARFSKQNLENYWAPLGKRSRELLADRPATAIANAETVRWIALGPSRLVATMESGLVLSKTEAARFASDKWPDFSDLLGRAVASRAGEDVQFTVADARLAIALLEKCVAVD